MSVRARKIGQEIKELLPNIIRKDLKNPLIDSLVSVTDVEVTSDLSYATIYISRLGNTEEREALLNAFCQSAGFIRKQLSKQLRMRSVPELRFKLDDSLEYGEKIERIIHGFEYSTGDDING